MKFRLIKNPDPYYQDQYLLQVRKWFVWRLLEVYNYSGGVDNFDELLRKVKIRATEHKYPLVEFDL